jgi:hypothetical protein
MINHDQLQFDLRQSASVRLLKSPNAPLILSFLHRTFKREQRASVSYAALLERLDATLEALNERNPGLYPLGAAAYLKQWSDDEHQLIRIIVRGSDDETTVELTADAERAISWVEELYQREFVGTESRFWAIFNLLEEIVARSTEDVEQRLAQLEHERAAIDAEIVRIRESGRVEPLTSTQVKERFLQAGEVARMLLRDFAAVEQNFRAIARKVQEQQLRPEARKGTVVGYVLDADEELRASDQGRSFYAFWEFLTVPARQDELHTLLDQVYNLPALQELAPNHPLLRRLSRALLEAGEKIVQPNHRLAEQLRRLLDDRALAESRRVRELIDAIKRHAARLADAPPEGTLLWLEGLPDVSMPMEKLLWEPNVATLFAAGPQEAGDIPDDTSIGALDRQFYVDERRLQQRIEAMLETRPACTLAELLDIYPAEADLKGKALTLETIDEQQSETVQRYNNSAKTLSANLGKLESNVVAQMVNFKRDYPADTADLDSSIAAVGECRRMLERIERDDLPTYRQRFKQWLDGKVLDSIVGFKGALDTQVDTIRESVENLNRSLRMIDYTAATSIRLRADPTRAAEVQEFRRQLRACIPVANLTIREYYDQKAAFEQLAWVDE